jgi:cytochrome c oxidase subunit 2
MLAVVTAPTAAATMSKKRTAPVIAIVATADQKFSPDHVVLHANQRRTLRFSSTGGVHGIASPELGIPSTMIQPGTPVSIDVTPKKAGTYTVPCSIVCGPGHADMALTVEVKK